MRKFGLIGNPLTHSFSKNYFEAKFAREKILDCGYDLYPLAQIEDLFLLLRTNTALAGLNVTIPYKESVIPFLDILDDSAKAIKAVNCILIDNSKLIGFNTDAIGFELSLKDFLPFLVKQAFILGTGGSSKAVEYALKKSGIDFLRVSREAGEGKITYADIAGKLKQSNLFINTTPLGMYPNPEDFPPIPYQSLTASDYLFDLVYNPAETTFLKKGKALGAHTKNGLQMLQIQAEKSWEIWNSPAGA